MKRLVNQKRRFIGIEHHWFTNILENAKKLKVGQIYTITSIDPASSWTACTLAETGDDMHEYSRFIDPDIDFQEYLSEQKRLEQEFEDEFNDEYNN